MAQSVEDRVNAAIARVPSLDHQKLLSLKQNAISFGAAAKPLVDAIDARLEAFDSSGGWAKHRSEFARSMLGLVERHSGWVASRDLFNHAKVEFSDNPFVAYMAENSARAIPLTKALAEALSEFPNVEYRKDGTGQSDRIFYCRRS